MYVVYALLLAALVSTPLPKARADDDVLESITVADCRDASGNEVIKEECCNRLMWIEAWQPNSLMRQCIAYSKDMSKRNESIIYANENEHHLALLVGCYYKKKKYMGPGKTFNMTRVKEDAAGMRDPYRRKFVVDMYEDCAGKANETLKTYEAKDPSMLKDEAYHSRAYYFMIAHVCLNNYSKTHACPYFHWAGTAEKMNAVCRSYSKKCRRLLREKKTE